MTAAVAGAGFVCGAALAASVTPSSVAPAQDGSPAVAAPAAVASPRLVYNGEPTRVLGLTRRAQRVETGFTLRNEGQAPLVVSNAFALGCRCVTLTVPPPIPPGGEADLVALIDTTDLGGKTVLRVNFGTNDPAQPRVSFEIQLDVEMMVNAKPGYVRYSIVQGEETGTIVQTVWAKDRDDLEVLSVGSPFPHLDVEWREARPEERLPQGRGRQWRIVATLRNDSPVGALEGTIDVTTNHDTDRVLRLPVSGFVRPLYSVTPPVLDFGEFGAAGSGRRKRAYLDSFGVRGLRPVSVKSTVPWITASLAAVEPGRRYDIFLSLPEVAPAGPFEGLLVIESTSADPKLRRIEVPMRGKVIAAQTSPSP